MRLAGLVLIYNVVITLGLRFTTLSLRSACYLPLCHCERVQRVWQSHKLNLNSIAITPE